FIACKQNEIIFRRIKEYAYITDNAYTESEITNMEEIILKTLNFNILFPSALSFYEIISPIKKPRRRTGAGAVGDSLGGFGQARVSRHSPESGTLFPRIIRSAKVASSASGSASLIDRPHPTGRNPNRTATAPTHSAYSSCVPTCSSIPHLALVAERIVVSEIGEL
ncbi:MAG: cyclin, partial [Thermoguttaceae bacterium]|nr:cyclin [Thermoguttaceae bacterium]